MEPGEAAMLLGAGLPVLSLTAGAEQGQEWDLPVDSPAEGVADRIALRQVLDSLEEPERHLVECRYFKSMTQSQTAGLLGMTQVQVSRKEKAILAKLRGWLG